MSTINDVGGGNDIGVGEGGGGKIEGHIYIYKNDPKLVHKGVNITDVRQAQGGFLPLLAYTPYSQRRHDNTSYVYNARSDHGSRPMHQSTISLSHCEPNQSKNQFITQNDLVKTWFISLNRVIV